MSQVLRKSSWMWGGFLASLGLVLLLMGGCDCGGSPGKEGANEGGSGEIVNVDGGGGDGVASCSRRCDCPQGQECSQGQCVVPLVPVYCCDRAGCPEGKECQDNNSAAGTCQQRKSCTHNCDCNQGLACTQGQCVPADAPVYCCEQSNCPAGKTCNSVRGGTQVCGSEGSPCTTACECMTGLACINGQCSKGTEPIYCCDSGTCPQGQTCETRKGARSTCGDAKECKSTCDCPVGQACANGRCEAQPVPVYCCNRPEQCPSGQVCDTPDGQRQKCPDKPGCQQHCDCPQGQFCEKGSCIVGTSPVYCCARPGCPSKAACFQKDGSVGSCPTSTRCVKDSDCGKPSCRQQGTACAQAVPRCTPDGVCINEVSSSTGTCDPTAGKCVVVSQCKTHCDCPQSQACTGGRCVKERTPRYCCEKAGCPSGLPCYQANGTSGTCKQTQCNTDKDCGVPTCRQLEADCGSITVACADGACRSNVQVIRNATCRDDGVCEPRQSQVCRVHCDCSQGLTCSNGQCIKGPAPLFCCDKAGCPSGQGCVRRDNSRSTCSTSTACKSDADCGRPSCTQSGSTCVQNTPRCDVSTGTCQGAGSAGPGRCDPATGRCQAAQFCKHPCDCPQGQTCAPGPAGDGVCEQGPTPLYCCEKAGCPSGQKCINRNSTSSTCPTVCKTPCECAPGESCVNNTCTASTSNPVYCCNNTQYCPAGAACMDKAGVKGTCSTKPRACQSPCDCVQGESCVNNVCQKSSTPSYCCDLPGCPSGQQCTNKLNQTGTCPTTCRVDCDCPQGQRCYNGACTTRFGVAYCCSKPGCPSNFSCSNPNGSRSRCPVKTCSSACDCPQGEDCRNGQCTRVSPAVYCCSNQNCPSGQACKNKDGSWSTCSGQAACKTLCDCPQGRDCYKGQCIQVFPAVYCCSKTDCPPGQACYDSNNTPSVCPGAQCTTACDCPNQGQACVRGRCVSTNPRTFCCDKPNCLAGNACEDKNGTADFCPGQACKVSCDCPQGQECRAGVCTRVSPPVYCCDTPGCFAGQACVKKDGTASTCPVQCRVDCDCPGQGYRCARGTCYRVSGAYCCSKPNCPPGNRCTTNTGQASVCSP